MADHDMSEICKMELLGFGEPLGTDGNDAGGDGEVIGGGWCSGDDLCPALCDLLSDLLANGL